MLLWTDFAKFPTRWTTTRGESGESVNRLAGASIKDIVKMLPALRKANALILHERASVIFFFVLLFGVLPFLRKPLIVVDLILRRPKSEKERRMVRVKRTLLSRVDHFIHYFKELRPYSKMYGIGSNRSSYVPFKGNIFGDPRVEKGSETPGEYVLAAGQSLRDFDTFFEAIALTGLPAAISRPDPARLSKHGARLTWSPDRYPKSLTLLNDDGGPDGWFQNLCRARVVVIPTLRSNLCASGIGTYLDAMLLKKCVVISDGPGVSDVLTDEAVIVPAEDPAALAKAIQEVWNDSARRSEIAAKGQRYAVTLGGEPELMARILESAVTWLNSRSKAV